MSTVYSAFTRTAARRGDAEFLCVEAVTAASYGIDAGPRSWREVASEVERLRASYAQAGYGHGHRVGLLLENRPAFFTHWLALNALGVSIVPIHADMQRAEWQYLIRHSEISCSPSPRPGKEAGLRAAAARSAPTCRRSAPRVAGRIPAARVPARSRAASRSTATAMRPALHLGHHRQAQGLPSRQRLLPAAPASWYLGLHDMAEVVPDIDRFITPLPLSHMNALAFSSMAAILSGGCPGPARPVPPGDLVAERSRQSGDDRRTTWA
jgi:acyl-CoA synthetase (AMP-forming)/AMP-acid ligase II